MPFRAVMPTLPCRCGHEPAAHEHFRRGTDCGQCGAQECRVYRPDHRVLVTREPVYAASA